MTHRQDNISGLDCQLTELSGFDYLLEWFNPETDGSDARADDLTRRHSNKRPKTKSIQKAAERDRGRTPKRLSGRLRDRSALDFSFSFVCGAGVCLSRRAQRADLYKTSTREGAKERIMTANKRIYPKFFVGCIWTFYGLPVPKFEISSSTSLISFDISASP